jgi:hypothetical protein
VVNAEIEQALEAADRSVADGGGLAGTGFWGAVAKVKADPALIESYADRIAAIDAAAFSNWAMVAVPVGVGTAVVAAASIVALGAVAAAYPLDGFAAIVALYAGLGILLVTTHGLGHLVVGGVLGIRFTNWFLGPPSFPFTGGVKIDYASYLRAPAERRARIHAAGAVVTKFVPFLLIGAAIAADLPAWAVWGLPAIGAATIATDVAWSRKKSDWKRYRREMTYAG